MPRWPVEVPRATPHGAYGYVRRTKADGACGFLGNYPCTHTGLDLAGTRGTPVYAPEPLSVHAMGTGSLPPFRGYKPGAMIARGLTSGVYHLFGHLEPGTMPSPTQEGTFWDFMTTPLWRSSDVRRQIKEGERIGLTSSANHVHWEVRSPGWDGARTNPAAWLAKYADVDVGEFTYGASSGTGGGALVVLGLLLFGGKKRRRR